MSKVPATTVPAAVYATPITKANAANINAKAINPDAIREKVLSKLMDGGLVESAQSAKDRFLNGAFGGSVGARVGSVLDQIRVNDGGYSHNPLDNQGPGFFTGRAGMASDAFTDFLGFVGSVAASVGVGAELGLLPVVAVAGAGAAGAAVVVGGLAGAAGAGYMAGQAVDSGFEMVTGMSIADAIIAAPPAKKPSPFSATERGTPLPDGGYGSGGDSPYIYGVEVRGINARKGSKGEPVDDGTGGSGGPIAASKTSTQANFVSETGLGGRTDAKLVSIAIEVVVNSKVSVV